MSNPKFDKKGKLIIPSNRPQVICGPSKTKTSERDACDINKMVARFKDSGVLPIVNDIAAQYADVSELGSYHDARNRIANAEQMFGSLPSKIRERFHNDPGELLTFFADEKNRDEAIKLGLHPKPEIKKPDEPAAPAKPAKKPEAAAPADSTEAKPKVEPEASK